MGLVPTLLLKPLCPDSSLRFHSLKEQGRVYYDLSGRPRRGSHTALEMHFFPPFSLLRSHLLTQILQGGQHRGPPGTRVQLPEEAVESYK